MAVLPQVVRSVVPSPRILTREFAAVLKKVLSGPALCHPRATHMKRALSLLLVTVYAVAAELPRPNILWITSEDHGQQMGCYGDALATTPNVDKLAARGMIYTHVWSCAPVCAPARTTLISGIYAQSTGGEHMRSLVAFPAGKKMFPQLLRDAGYYCSNNSKEDYNLAKPGKVWDESSKKAHWRNRTTGQPFFVVFNSEKSHESKIRARPHTLIHDPAKVRVPPYHPDTPEVRRDWAQYYDIVSEADADAGKLLVQLDADGLAENTIVFYFGDHGSGMPRSKRWPYDSGLRVPLVVFIPEKFKDLRPPDYKVGGTSDRLVSFVDCAPTVLSLAGVKAPEWMQGRAFLGKFIADSKDRPFFLYLPHSMPHVPLHVSDKFRGKSRQGLYGDVIEEIDWSVGQVMAALKQHGLDDNTLVLFTSDNGPWLSYGSHAGSAGPLREGKGTSWEGGTRVPCIMRWPGTIPA